MYDIGTVVHFGGKHSTTQALAGTLAAAPYNTVAALEVGYRAEVPSRGEEQAPPASACSSSMHASKFRAHKKGKIFSAPARSNSSASATIEDTKHAECQMEILYFTFVLAGPAIAVGLHRIHAITRHWAAQETPEAKIEAARDHAAAKLSAGMDKARQASAAQLALIVVRLERIEQKIDKLA